MISLDDIALMPVAKGEGMQNRRGYFMGLLRS